jgi:DNA-binding beta-propeller fold protein YncE
LLPVFFLSLVAVLGSFLGTNPPFQGKELNQLQATSTFLTSVLTAIASGWGLAYLLKSWPSGQSGRVMTLTFFGLVSLLTIRTAYTAAYINYNNAKEYLVYAHSGPGAKEIMQQVDDLSRRTTDGLAMEVAYDDITTYPFWWYLRDYTNQRFYGKNPTRDLREVPIILVGAENYSKIEPVVGQAYYQFDYVRMWWPDQGYFNLSFDRVWNALINPEWRQAIFQIWFNRDYTLYGNLNGSDLSLPNWSPADRMRMYVRKDVAALIWNLGVGPTAEEVVADPYQGKEAQLNADIVLGETGAAPGQFMRPRDLAVAPDGSIYVADTENNRIQHIARDGSVLQVWGSFADITQGDAPGGTFNQPWGIALGPDGSVYVADLWNSRIQKFAPDGKFVLMWGYFGQGEAPTAFWGPRDVVVDSQGHVLVSDTGNKRVVIFDADGNYISQFGSEGFSPGQFSEPVGLAIDGEGKLYVADTWNQRIQVFAPDSTGSYTPLTSWDVYGWFGQSVDNKPYLAADDQGHIFATDPEAYRVLEFTSQGDIIRYWGDYGAGTDGFGLAGSVAVDPLGGVWVSDTNNGRLMHFALPPEP